MRFLVKAENEGDFEIPEYVNQAYKVVPLVQLLGLIINK